MTTEPLSRLPQCDLVIVLPHLGPGGAQKVALLAADHFLAAGLKVVLVTLLPDKPRTHQLPDALDWIDLGDAVAAGRSNRAFIARAGRFTRVWTRRLIAWLIIGLGWPWLQTIRPGQQAALVQWLLISLSGPQAALLQALLSEIRPPRVLSLLTKTNLLCCQALWDLPGRLVVSERNDPRLQRLQFPWALLQSWLWQRADGITANTSGVLTGLQACYPDQASAMQLLPNPLVVEGLDGSSMPCSAGSSGGFLAVCRLVPQKGIDLLIRAYALLPQALRAIWPLTIAGDGPERHRLEQLADALLLRDQVSFLGFQANPQPLYRDSAVFVLPSRFEGMPNALLEAMGNGLAVIVTDASPGPLEVVMDGQSGLVVPSEEVEALALAMQRLAERADLRQRLGVAAQVVTQQQSWTNLDACWRSVLGLVES